MRATRCGVTGADDVVAALTAVPVPVPEAEVRIPSGPGLYAWWAAPGVLPGIVGPAHPAAAGLELLYVGIGGGLRERMVDRHVRGGTGGSTLRRSLAGLLLDVEGLRTRWTKTRVVLVADDERRLTTWIRTHLSVSWCEHPDAGAVEPSVIAVLGPPLNLDHNTSHAAYSAVKAARAAWRASAGPQP
jgi:hypothetical protein